MEKIFSIEYVRLWNSHNSRLPPSVLPSKPVELDYLFPTVRAELGGSDEYRYPPISQRMEKKSGESLECIGGRDGC